MKNYKNTSFKLFKKNYNISYTFQSIYMNMFFDKMVSKNYVYDIYIYNIYNVMLYKFWIKLDISLKNLSLDNDNDNRKLLAAYFLLFYLTNSKPFVSNIVISKTFNKQENNVIVSLVLRKDKAFNFLEFYLTKIYLKNSYTSNTKYNNQDVKDNNDNVKKKILFHKNLKHVELIHKWDDLKFLKIVEFHSIFLGWDNEIKINFYWELNSYFDTNSNQILKEFFFKFFRLL